MTSSRFSSDELNDPTFLDCAPLESSTPLEASAPLDYREIKPITQASVAAPVAFDTANADVIKRNALQVENDTHQPASAVEPTIEHPADRQEPLVHKRSLSIPTVVEEEKVQLLEERLVVDRKKRKIGDVIVRKVIETQIVEVPVRREKLLVEQIGSEPRQLASIDLGQPTTDAVAFTQGSESASQLAVGGKFTSIKAASQFLATLASSQPNLGCQNVQVKIVVDTVEQQQLYQQWLNRYVGNQRSTFP